jgi:hypothetical protein
MNVALKSMKVEGPDTLIGCSYCGRGHPRDFGSDKAMVIEPTAELDKFSYRKDDHCSVCYGDGEPYKGHKLLVAGDGKGNGVVIEYRGWGPTMDIREDGLTNLGDMGLADAPKGLSVFEASRYDGGGVYSKGRRTRREYSEAGGYMDGYFRDLTPAEWAAMMAGTPLFHAAPTKE